jgi:hypothetical protein
MTKSPEEDVANAKTELEMKVRSLHAALNELYSVNPSWKARGNWPEEVTGSILHPPASEREIAAAERRLGLAFPPSYRDFLSLHRAWEHFWADFTLIGTGDVETERARAEVDEYVTEQTDDLRKKLGKGFAPESIAAWEAREKRLICLANQLVIGTNFAGALWVYDTRSRRPDGEMTLTQWDISYGAQEPEFSTFDEFMEWARSEVEHRIQQTREALTNPTQHAEDDDDE